MELFEVGVITVMENKDKMIRQLVQVQFKMVLI